MKKLILSITAIAITSLVNAQSIKDFYIPKAPNNKAEFYSPNESGNKSTFTRNIYYLNRGTHYEVLDAHLNNGKPTSIINRNVKFTNNEVQMVSSTSTTMFKTNQKQSYNPPEILLKMPAEGKTITWYGTETGDKVKYIASWETVTYYDKKKKSIKLVKQIDGTSFKTIEHYVEGVGLWTTEFQGSNGKIKLSEQFDGLTYDQSAK